MNTLATTPTRSFDRLNQVMEEMLGGRYDLMPWGWYDFTPWTPSVDILETDKEFTFHCELPGFKPNDVDIELANDTLTIRGKREWSEEQKNYNYIRRERKYGEFRRSFKLDTHVRPDGIDASFKDGMLTIKLPKIEAVKPKKISVKA